MALLVLVVCCLAASFLTCVGRGCLLGSRVRLARGIDCFERTGFFFIMVGGPLLSGLIILPLREFAALSPPLLGAGITHSARTRHQRSAHVSLSEFVVSADWCLACRHRVAPVSLFGDVKFAVSLTVFHTMVT